MKHLDDHVKFEPTKWGMKAVLTVSQEDEIGNYKTEEEMKDSLRNELREYICDFDFVQNSINSNKEREF